MTDTLDLVLTGQWFDMIASGEKLEEYRSMSDFWRARLTRKPFQRVRFRHGYGKHARYMILEVRAITESMGFVEWGAQPGVTYYVIKLGNFIEQGRL